MSRLKIYHLDVGQGDSTVILYFDDNFQPEYSILIDCGENSAYLRVVDILRENGFLLLNTIVLTHYDSDHFAGVIELIKLGANKSGTIVMNLLAGTQIWDPGIPGDIQEKNFFDNYLKGIEKLRERQFRKGVQPIHRITANMMGEMVEAGGDFSDFTLQEFDGYKDDSFVMKEPSEPIWFVPRRAIKTSRHNRQSAYRTLYKNKFWPIEMDVVYHGMALAQMDEHATKLPKPDTTLPLSLQILIGNGAGLVNESGKDPLDVVLADVNSPQIWKDRIINEAGDRVLAIAQSKDENELGMGYLLEYKNFRYWFGGDLTSNQEDALTSAIGKLSVLKAGHHGSHHSTSIRFLAETQPKVVTISTATEWNATVQLPHVETLQRIQDCPSVQGVFFTGMSIPDDIRPSFIPGPETPFDINAKFKVAGTQKKASSEILLLITEEEAAEEDPRFTVLYHEQNTRGGIKRKREPMEGERVAIHVKKRRIIEDDEV